MNKFIELTHEGDGRKIALDIFSILSIAEGDGYTDIHMSIQIGSSKSFFPSTITVIESYDFVMNSIGRALINEK